MQVVDVVVAVAKVAVVVAAAAAAAAAAAVAAAVAAAPVFRRKHFAHLPESRQYKAESMFCHGGGMLLNPHRLRAPESHQDLGVCA